MKNIQTRRDFFKISITLSGGLMLGFNMKESPENAPNLINSLSANGAEFNSYLAIEPSGKVIIYSPNPEIGQGIKTAFPLIVAEELDVDWKNVEVRQADLNTAKFERQLTGGSGAIKHSWERLRKAGATAKNLITQAAAQQWNVPIEECKAENGFIIHNSGKKLGYGELAAAAALLKAPDKVELKNPKDFKLIGKSFSGVDNAALLVGKPLFGIDYKVEGMLHAQIQRPPSFGMKLKSFDASETKKMPGIIDVVSFGDKVAIVGKSTWEVMQARKTLKVEYTNAAPLESSVSHNKTFTELMDKKEAEMRRKDGDIEKAFKEAHKIIEAEYQCPFLPHNAMEPMNFFADVKADKATLAGPTQTPQNAQSQISKLLNIPDKNITVALTKMGGGFGRRLNNDYALEAAELSSIIKAPVKLLWTREDDMTAGIYRPAVRYKFKASLDKNGNLTGYYLKGVGMNAGNNTRHDNFPAGAVDNLLIETIDYKSPITTGPWRAPITNFLASAEQSFLDEVAQAAGKDPIQFRLDLFAKSKTNPVGKITYEPDRFIEVIKTVAEKAEWGKKKKKVSQGFAVYFSHLSYVGQIAEMIKVKGKPVLKKVYAVTDCGIVINQSGARNQIYGAIVDGIGHAMYGNITFENGAPQQSNFDKFRMIKFNEIPEIEAHFIDNGIEPTGLGEPALPPTGGALANAFAKLTGKRFYKQPFINEDKSLNAIT
jgi:isoquinoline 1-oxidoreductase subunit beta